MSEGQHYPWPVISNQGLVEQGRSVTSVPLEGIYAGKRNEYVSWYLCRETE